MGMAIFFITGTRCNLSEARIGVTPQRRLCHIQTRPNQGGWVSRRELSLCTEVDAWVWNTGIVCSR
jgi:hypothetical protein